MVLSFCEISCKVTSSLLSYNGCFLRPPNARLHLLLEAGARHERTLEAVRCKPWLAAATHARHRYTRFCCQPQQFLLDCWAVKGFPPLVPGQAADVIPPVEDLAQCDVPNLFHREHRIRFHLHRETAVGFPLGNLPGRFPKHPIGGPG